MTSTEISYSYRQLTEQGVVDKIFAWFLQPDALYGANEDDGETSYRGTYKGQDPADPERRRSQRRCPAGVMFPDQDWRLEFEGTPIRELIIQGKLPARLHAQLEVHAALLQELQDAHDAAPVAGIRDGAENREVVYTVLKNMREVVVKHRLVDPTPPDPRKPGIEEEVEILDQLYEIQRLLKVVETRVDDVSKQLGITL